MDEKGIRRKVKDLAPWFHNIHLTGDIQTAPDHPLGDFPGYKWKSISPYLPEDMRGMKVLDVGCNAGYYTFECAGRGAHVTAIDIDSHYLKQASWLSEFFKLEDKIDIHQLQVYDLAAKKWDFDLVLFLGVFYHLRYPLLALDIISQMAKDKIIFQSLSMDQENEKEPLPDIDFSKRHMLQEKSWPAMAFIENRFQDDPTNWWVPNPALIKAMFRTSGFRFLENPSHEIFIFERDPEKIPVSLGWNRSEFLSATGHAWKKEVTKKTGHKERKTLES